MVEKKKEKTLHVSTDCIGCGTCENIAPEYFEMKDGLSTPTDKLYDEKDKDIIDEAINSCPVQAITLE